MIRLSVVRYLDKSVTLVWVNPAYIISFKWADAYGCTVVKMSDEEIWVSETPYQIVELIDAKEHDDTGV